MSKQIGDYDASTDLFDTDHLLVQRGEKGQGYKRVSGATVKSQTATTPVLFSGTTNARSLAADLLDGVNIARFAGSGSDFGDDVISDTAMFQRAIDWSKQNNGRPVYVPPAPVRYRINTALTNVEGATLIGLGRPEIHIDLSGTLMTINGTGNVRLEGLRFYGNQVANQSFAIMISDGADDCVLRDLFCQDHGSFIRSFGDRCKFEGIKCAQLNGTLIRLDGQAHDNVIYDYGGQNFFTGINLDDAASQGALTGPHHNLIMRGRKIVVPADMTPYQLTQTGAVLFDKHVYVVDPNDGTVGEELTTYGGDIISATVEAYENTARDNETQQSRDGSGTFNGNHWLVEGHRSRNGLGSGIGCFGSYNQFTDFHIINCRRGIYATTAFGGYGTRNTFKGGHIDQCRYYGVSVGEIAIRLFVANATYGNGTRYTMYFDGTQWNTYLSTTNVTTFGPTPPTHTSGSAGDGGTNDAGQPTSWVYMSSSALPQASGNIFQGISVENCGIEAEVGASWVGKANWYNKAGALNYRQGCPGTADGVIPAWGQPQNNHLEGMTRLFRWVPTSTLRTLTADGQSPVGTNELQVGPGQTAKVAGDLLVKDSTSGNYQTWTFSFVVRRLGSESDNPSFLASPTITQSVGTSTAWMQALSPVVEIDNTNKSVRVRITGDATHPFTAAATFDCISVISTPETITGDEEITEPTPA